MIEQGDGMTVASIPGRGKDRCEMGQIPSSKDVAREAGVSQTTVSFVLNDRTDISIPQKTRDRVKRVARRLGYLPNRLARSLVSGRTQTIGLLVPRLDSSFCGGIAQGIQEASSDHGYRVIVANTTHCTEAHSLELECMLQHQVDGILCVACESIALRMEHWIERCRRAHVPFVLIDDCEHGDQADCIVSDDLTGAANAIDHLIELGHHRIAHLAGSPRVSSGRERRQGYQTALVRAGIPVDRSLVFGDSYLQGDIEKQLTALLRRTHPPTALFAANDILGAKVLRALRHRANCSQHRLAVVAYGNYPMGDFLELTTTDQFQVEMGKTAFSQLLQRMESPDALPFSVIRTPTQLIVRASSHSHQELAQRRVESRSASQPNRK